MNKLLATDPGNRVALVARLALGFTIFPHGAQKLLGWFGGYGFDATMRYFTGQVHLPSIIGLLVIIIEFAGSLLLIVGLYTRMAAIAVFSSFLGVLFKIHIHNGFFMNWGMQPNKGEGFEFFILLFGLVLITLITGGGMASIDGIFVKNSNGAGATVIPRTEPGLQ